MEIIPAVIPHTARDVRAVADVISARPLMIHIDYVGRRYGGQQGGEFLPTRDMLTNDVSYEAHIMEVDKGRLLTHFLGIGVTRVIFQFEAFSEVHEIEELVHMTHLQGAEVGIALLIETPLSVLSALVPHIDFVQLMSIGSIGAQGRAFDERVLERIHEARALHTLPISVDGGITPERVVALKEAGADRLVVGSAIVKQPDPLVAFKKFIAAQA
ncbi:MAG: tryptophan synthase subunit alpha [Candidatus Pacebacteria bacterium]|nr:tryptophan synthase subunit alpha [Candidatus Paceibacterota bacterium]